MSCIMCHVKQSNYFTIPIYVCNWQMFRRKSARKVLHDTYLYSIVKVLTSMKKLFLNSSQLNM